jgi:hypothetical protein
MTKRWSSVRSDLTKTKRRASKAARKSAPVDDDESFADRAIQAQLDNAMGIDNPDYDWLVEPFE